MTLAPPALSDFRAEYPAFSGVADETVTYWLNRATSEVDESWPIITDRGLAMMAVAAHYMAIRSVEGLGDGEITALLASGVTDFQSGGREGFRVSFAPSAYEQTLSGDWGATLPGQEYLRLLRRNKGGPRVSAPGRAPRCTFMPGVLWGNR